MELRAEKVYMQSLYLPDGERLTLSLGVILGAFGSDIFLHKESALPWRQKAAAIRNEQHRVASRSSTNEPRNQAALREKLRANGYTARDLRRVSPSSRRRPARTMEDGGIHYLDLPFLAEAAERKILKAFREEGVRIRIYRRSTTILDVVRPKKQEIQRCTRPSCPTRSAGTCYVKKCVYEITCSPCGRRYVGSTTRPLHDRIREHLDTGRGSAIHEHLVACGGGAAQVRIRVLAREKDEVNTRLREAITIKRLRPELNTRSESDLVDFVF